MAPRPILEDLVGQWRDLRLDGEQNGVDLFCRITEPMHRKDLFGGEKFEYKTAEGPNVDFSEMGTPRTASGAARPNGM
jgi:hypothetical protein